MPILNEMNQHQTRVASHCRKWMVVAAMVISCLYANDSFLRFAVKCNPSTRVNLLLTSPPRIDRIAVLGSSMIANAISAKQLSEAVHDDVIQLAVGGQGLQEQALIWDLYIARHRCEVLVLELHDESLQRGAIPDPLREDRYSAYLDNTIVRRHLAEHCGAMKLMLWQYVPMYAFAEFSSKIGWQDWVGVAKGEAYDVYAPSIYADSQPSLSTLAEQSHKHQKRKPGDVDRSAVDALRSILNSAMLAGVRVVIVKPPRFDVGQTSERDAQGIRLQRSEIQSLEQVEFSIASQRDPTMFDDARHASERGSRQFTNELAAALVSLLR